MPCQTYRPEEDILDEDEEMPTSEPVPAEKILTAEQIQDLIDTCP